MTMAEIVGLEANIDCIVEIDHETTTEMTMGKKIIGGPKIRNIEKDIEIITETHMKIGIQTIIKMIIKTGMKTITEMDMKIGMRTIIKISIKTGTKIDIETSTEITIEMIALTEIGVGLEKDNTHITLEKIIVLLVTIQGLNDCTRSCNS